ncbi:MAG: nucleotidyltransferase domain-containing protein [Prochlorococcaceae cyanobacterium]
MTAQPSAPAELNPGIPGIPLEAQKRLEQLFDAQPRLEAVWLYGSRAMGRHQPGSDIDLCLEGAMLTHLDQLRLMAALDDLLLPWAVDVALLQHMPQERRLTSTG